MGRVRVSLVYAVLGCARRRASGIPVPCHFPEPARGMCQGVGLGIGSHA